MIHTSAMQQPSMNKEKTYTPRAKLPGHQTWDDFRNWKGPREKGAIEFEGDYSIAAQSLLVRLTKLKNSKEVSSTERKDTLIELKHALLSGIEIPAIVRLLYYALRHPFR